MIARLIGTSSNLHRGLAWLLILTILLQSNIPMAQAASTHHDTPPLKHNANWAVQANTRNAPADNASCGEPITMATFPPQVSAPEIKLDRCIIHTFNYNSADKKLVVYYTETNGEEQDRLSAVDRDGDGANEFTTEQIARLVATWVQQSWTVYQDHGFSDPAAGNNTFLVKMFSTKRFDMALGYYSPDKTVNPRYFALDSDTVRDALSFGADPRFAMAIIYHEMFHGVRYWGTYEQPVRWFDEGIANSMMDHVNLDVDLDDDDSVYLRWADTYLEEKSASPITALSYGYEASLWWTYFMEQIGAISTEPNRGVDAIKRLSDVYQISNPLLSIDNVTRSTTSDRDLASLWIDFTVANYAKELTLASLPKKYKYQDELQPGATQYAALPPHKLMQNTVLPAAGVTATNTVAPWSAHYYSFTVPANLNFINLDFQQQSGARIGYTLLLLRNNHLIKEERFVGRHFTRSFANDGYDQLAIIVSGLNEDATYRYAVAPTQPTLRLLDPLGSRQANAGDPTTPAKIVVKVEVVAAQNNFPVTGIRPESFTFTVIGGFPNQPQTATMIASSYLQGQYWFVLRPPAIACAATLCEADLAITWGQATVREQDALRYERANRTDHLVIVDRSGSMIAPGTSGAKMSAAKEAAKLYLASFTEGDQIGLISFNDQAVVDAALTPWSQETVNQMSSAIDSLTPTGLTTIGGALNRGLDELMRANSSHAWSLVLLSDGENTADPPPQAFLERYQQRKQTCANNACTLPTVHTIAFGADADRTVMKQIADQAGGTYHYAAEPVQTNVQAAGSQGGRFFADIDLLDIYRTIAEAEMDAQQIYSVQELSSGAYVTHTLVVDAGATLLMLAVKRNYGIPFCGIEATLYRPDGSLATETPTVTDPNHLLWQIASPPAGNWQLRLALFDYGIGNCVISSNQPHLVEAAVKSDLRLESFIGLNSAHLVVGNPLPFLVNLTDQRAILGATVNVVMTEPNDRFTLLTLYDDGLHVDGAANDGFYAAPFLLAIPGSYRAAITAEGSSQGWSFQRRLRVSFDVAPTLDSDGDGIPDQAEQANGTNPTQNDADADPDQDQLSNLTEYYLRTNPLATDSDNGGQSDGSEYSASQDATNPNDDTIRCLLDFQATNILGSGIYQRSAKAGVLHFAVDPSHHHYRLWRSTDPTGPWQLISDNVPATGQYIDQNISLKTTYYYRIQAIGHSGQESCVLGPRNTTPQEDPLAPVGTITINQGLSRVGCPTTLLTINASVDTTFMLIGNYSDFRDALWEPYRHQKQWALTPSEGRAQVYIKFRDGTGNESSVFRDEVAVDVIAEADRNNFSHSQTLHTAAVATIANNYTLLRHPSLDNNPDALLLETLNRTPGGSGDLVNAHPTGVWYTGQQWSIFNQDGAAMLPGVAYNLLMPSACTTAFVHRKTADDDTHLMLIDHPFLNNNPDAFIMATQHWNPPGSPGVYNNHNIGVQYNGSQWSIYNQDRQTMPVGAAFTILLPHADALRFVHQAQASNSNASQTELSHPMLDNNPNALIYATQKWSPNGVNPGLYNDHPIGVAYTGAKWVVFNQDGAAMPAGATFNVLIAPAVLGLTATNNGPTALGAPTTFNAAVTAGGQPTYHWDFGDGQTGSGATVQHTYANPGDHLVTVTATDKGGSATAQTMVLVTDAPLGSFKLFLPIVQR